MESGFILIAGGLYNKRINKRTNALESGLIIIIQGSCELMGLVCPLRSLEELMEATEVLRVFHL